MPQTGRNQSVISAVVFCATSLVITLVNKVLFIRFFFDFTVVLLMCQIALTLLVLEVMRLCRLLTLAAYTVDRGKETFLLSVFFCLSSVFSLNALSSTNVPMYGALKRCLPLVTLCLSVLLLSKPWPNRGLVFAVFCATVGPIFAGFADTYFDLWGLVYGVVSLICQAIYFTLAEKLLQPSGNSASPAFSIPDLVYLNSFNSLLILLVVDFCNDEIKNVYIFFLTSASPLFFATLATVVSLGFALSFALLWFVRQTSALSVSIVGNLRSVLQTILASWFGLAYFGDSGLSGKAVFGVVIALLGCGLYFYIKARTVGTVRLSPSRRLSSSSKDKESSHLVAMSSFTNNNEIIAGDLKSI